MGKNKSRHFFGKQNPLHSTFTCGSMTFTFQEENIPKIATKVWKHLDSTHWNLFFFCSNVLLYWRVSSFHPQTPLKKTTKKNATFVFWFQVSTHLFFFWVGFQPGGCVNTALHVPHRVQMTMLAARSGDLAMQDHHVHGASGTSHLVPRGECGDICGETVQVTYLIFHPLMSRLCL